MTDSGGYDDPAVWHHRTVEDSVRSVIEEGFAIDTLCEYEPAAGCRSKRRPATGALRPPAIRWHAV